MLIQEFLFRKALREMDMPVVSDFSINHADAVNINGGCPYSILFPVSMVDSISKMAQPRERSLDYTYTGAMTPQKRWVMDFADRPNAKITESSRSRDLALKYTIDWPYYADMHNSKFVLAPNDVYEWSYRFLEAVMCGAIPIISDGDTHLFASHFKYHLIGDIHVYRPEWADYNLKQLYRYHTLNAHCYEYPFWRGGRLDTHDGAWKINESLYRTDIENPRPCKAMCAAAGRGIRRPCLAVDTRNNRMVSQSNYYVSLGRYSTHATGDCLYARDHHQVFERLYFAWQKLCLDKSSDVIVVEDVSFWMANPFMGTNSGHDLSFIMNGVHYVRQRPEITNVVLLASAKWYPTNLTIMKMLLPEGIRLQFLDDDQVYEFPKLHVTDSVIGDIRRHLYLFDEVIAWAGSRAAGKKIIMCKCARNKAVVMKATMFACDTLIRESERDGFVFVNPEEVTPEGVPSFISMLRNADTIVCSWGSILYTHMNFFNPAAKVIILKPERASINPFWDHAVKIATDMVECETVNLDSDSALTALILSKMRRR